jgi:GH35 family endo-1,4-beta-xylanase
VLRGLAGGKPLIGTAIPGNFDRFFTAEEASLLATQFDSLTPENCMKWQSLCPKEGDYRFGPIDQVMDFAAKHKQSVVGHTLIFNRDGNYPAWLFKLAAGIDPKAKLTYNDFAVERPDRLKAILAFVRALRDKGCKIDVVGSQSHLEIGDKVAEQVDKMLQQFGAEGFRCALTELDVDVISRARYWNPKTREQATQQDPYVKGCPPEILEQQATVYREIMEAVKANGKHVDRVTFWGFTDRRSWLNTWPWKRTNHGLLFDREARPKPAFHAVADVLKKKPLPLKQRVAKQNL